LPLPPSIYTSFLDTSTSWQAGFSAELCLLETKEVLAAGDFAGQYLPQAGWFVQQEQFDHG
jgi:hypothetical protein